MPSTANIRSNGESDGNMIRINTADIGPDGLEVNGAENAARFRRSLPMGAKRQNSATQSAIRPSHHLIFLPSL